MLVGNSLGGAVAIEAAALMLERIVGIVGVDTFHDLGMRLPIQGAQRRAAALRLDSRAACHQMAEQFFHAGADPRIRSRVEEQMLTTSPAGDLWPVDVERNRAIVPDFTVQVIPETGHFVMLERLDEFDYAPRNTIAELCAI